MLTFYPYWHRGPAASTMMLVLVQYDFHYTAKDGRLVSIKPNESYILVCKTNEHWWRVRRDQSSQPFYVPAQYVKEIPDRSASPERGDIITAVMTQPEACGLSAHGFCGDVPETDKLEQTSSSSVQIIDEEYSSGSSLNSQPNDSSELCAKPVFGHSNQSESLLQVTKHDDDIDFPPSSNLLVLDHTPEENLPEIDEQFEPPEPDFKGKPRRQAADGGAKPSTDQVKSSCCNNIFIYFLHVLILWFSNVVFNQKMSLSPFK